MSRDEIEKLRQIHATKGLRLDTARGLSGTIYGADGSVTAPVTALIDECERSFDKDAEIIRLTARIAELEKALRDVAEAKMPGLARYIARTTLEASERGGGE